MLTEALATIARRAGIEIIPAWRLRQLPVVQYLQRLFSLLGTRTVIDVGANRGQFCEFLRREVRFAGSIVSVEPVPALAALLRERAAGDARWRIVECALGERDGTTKINIMAETEFSSILQPDTTVLGDFSGKNIVREQVEVAMRTLDSLLAEILSDGDPGVMHLKLDTQGYDLSVARGGASALARCASLQTEIAFERAYAGMPGYAEAIEAFRALGFVPSAMFPNHVSHYFPRLVELDCYMVAQASLLPREELR